MGEFSWLLSCCPHVNFVLIKSWKILRVGVSRLCVSLHCFPSFLSPMVSFQIHNKDQYLHYNIKLISLAHYSDLVLTSCFLTWTRVTLAAPGLSATQIGLVLVTVKIISIDVFHKCGLVTFKFSQAPFLFLFYFSSFLALLFSGVVKGCWFCFSCKIFYHGKLPQGRDSTSLLLHLQDPKDTEL